MSSFFDDFLKPKIVDIKDLRVRNLASFKENQSKDEKTILQKIDQMNLEGKTPILVFLINLLFFFFLLLLFSLIELFFNLNAIF